MKKVKEIINKSMDSITFENNVCTVTYGETMAEIIIQQIIDLFNYGIMSEPAKDILIEDIVTPTLALKIINERTIDDNGMMAVDVIFGKVDFNFNILNSSLQGIKGYTIG